MKPDASPPYIDFSHLDILNDLNGALSLTEKLGFVYQVVNQKHDFVHRISIALYDPTSDVLKTFTHSSDSGNPLSQYEITLSEAPSLKKIASEGKTRVINDLSIFLESPKEHARRIGAHGYQSSYTIPIYFQTLFIGFVFFNSRRRGVFEEDILQCLDMVARLIALIVDLELRQVQTLHGALKTATCFSSHKDPETAEHLERMARFSRLIAKEIAGTQGLNDEFIENILWFAPMHDIGKIAIPDHILLKPGKFTADEFELMKTHTTKGREIIASMSSHFNLGNSDAIAMICNIAEYHHENIDGSGYPFGLKGDRIPLEARIIAVADVFDALTSRRPYKRAWSNEETYTELRKLSSWKLDPQCVEALLANHKQIDKIQKLFRDEWSEDNLMTNCT